MYNVFYTRIMMSNQYLDEFTSKIETFPHVKYYWYDANCNPNSIGCKTNNK